ncbi:rhomboid-like protein [Quadrisphaera setariae]|uniref:rhomboid-like protein n=1 Tax=Quadrisphaera setariae TaxID=2593304 RepID=UPI001C9C2440|nr:rhomboid-like protein [Quadrisphaera setariae]
MGAPWTGPGLTPPDRSAGAPRRWWPGWARGGGLALAYAALVLLVAIVLAVLPEDVHQRAVLSASTNIENLRHAPAAVLLLSAFVVRDFAEVLLLLPLVVVMTVCSRRIGRLSTVVAALFGHVGATLVVATFVAAGVRRGFVPHSVTTAPDVGVSYALAGMAGLLAAALPRRWRWAYVVGGLVALVVLISVDTDFTNAGHLLAFATGLGLAAVAVQARRSPSTPSP